MDNNRGQAAVTPIGPAVTLCIAGVVGYVALQTMSQAAEQTSPEDVEYLCAGVFGCGAPSLMDLLVLALPLILIGMIILAMVTRFDRPTERGEGRTQLQVVKEQYVKGDIDTVLTLEDRLEDVLDDEGEDGDG